MGLFPFLSYQKAITFMLSMRTMISLELAFDLAIYIYTLVNNLAIYQLAIAC